VAGGCARCQERRPRRCLDRGHEVIDRHLDERDAVGVRVRDQIERDVDPSAAATSSA
jgi:hypothetical protein